MIRLIIKGDMFAAYRAATANGVSIDALHELRRGGVCETIAHAPAEHTDAVVRWFCATRGPAPFPQGTLLHHA